MKSILAGLTILTLIVGGVYAVDQIYARQAYADEIKVELRLVQSRLETKILDDRLINFESRLWNIKDRHGKDCGQEKNECRKLKQDIGKLKRQLSK